MNSNAVRSRVRVTFTASILAALVVAATFDDAGAVVLDSQASCQRAITKAGRVYATSELKILQKCTFAQLSGGDDAGCSAARVDEALAKIAFKFDATVTKSCESLTDEDLSAPRPAGLSLAPLASLLPSLRAEHDRLVDVLMASLYPPLGATPGDEALDCQAALDRAAASFFATAFKLVGNSCHAREDSGKSVTGEVSRIVEACLETQALALDAAAAKPLSGLQDLCSGAVVTELSACPTLTSDRTIESVADCLFGLARDAAAAALAAEHGRDRPRVIGRIEAHASGNAAAAADASAVLVAQDGSTISSAVADANGRVELTARALERVSLCWDHTGNRSCSDVPIDVGIETVFFGDRAIDVPVGANEQALLVRVLREDASPCIDATPTSEIALRGSVLLAPTGSPAVGERHGIGQDGGVFVFTPVSGEHSVHASCGTEDLVVDLGLSPDPTNPIVIQMTNVAPTDGSIEMTSGTGEPVTDPSLVNAGDTISLHASFVDSDPLEYRWEITRGDGSLGGSGLPGGDDRRASGPDVSWVVGGSSGIHQVTLWASDGRGGIETLVETLGPIDVGDITPGPCIALPKLQKILCGTGYTAAVPTPGGGLSDFLSYKYRNASRNSAGDACLYYNVVDPECIDMNCDGVVDAGTDPMGKCKRTTLGGWWQKNGFSTTGLGSDVITAWYLNSNDLGFGREMHCRVTSWSSIIAERPINEPTSASRMVEALRSDILASPQVVQWSKLFGLYPSTVACYVVNYTTDHCFNYPTNDPQNANLAYQGQQAFVANPSVNPPNAYGTVAMEFGPVEGFGEVGAITKFFVYSGHTASGKRLTAANLDGCGPKSVPELCMNCHGGSWPGNWSQGATLDGIVAGLTQPGLVLAGIDATDTAPTDAGFLLRKSIIAKLTREESGFSSFLPFDPDTYVFPAAASSAVQAADIRRLNQLVLYTKPVTPISDLVKGWYGNNLTTGTFAAWRPTAWNDDGGQPGDESDLHDDVYARACRVCHAAHYSFSSWTSFPSSSRICKNGSGIAGGSPTMPHAKLTYLNLWKGDYPQAPTMTALEAWFTASEGGFTSCD